MSVSYPWSWCASIDVNTTAIRAYEFLVDGMNQSDWAMGSWNRRKVDDEISMGTSLFDGKELFVKPVGRRDLLLIDYYCGPRIDSLVWQVEVRIISGNCVGLASNQCLINMTTWRDSTTRREEWEFVQHLWEVEISLIKRLLEQQG